MNIVELPLGDVRIVRTRRTLRGLEELQQSIREVGLLNPITVTTENALIAGYHRLEACKALGWEKIPAVVMGFGEIEAEIAEIVENLMRHDLDVLERGELYARLKELREAMYPETKRGVAGGIASGVSRRGEERTTAESSIVRPFAEDVADKTGISSRVIRREIQIAKSIAPEVKEAIRNTEIADSKTELLALARLEPEKQKQVAKKIEEKKAKTVKEAVREVRKDDADAFAPTWAPSEGMTLVREDIRNLDALPPQGFDAIITDPPYDRESVPLFHALSEFAFRHLREGGSCFVMTGQIWLPEILDALSFRLRYHWTLAYLMPGGQAAQMWQHNVNQFWKPVLWFVKGKYAGKWVGDVTKSVSGDKRFHEWGQSEDGMADLVTRVTEPGDYVCDPFLGGGTTALVCQRLQRRFLGMDNDESALSATKYRLSCYQGEA